MSELKVKKDLPIKCEIQTMNLDEILREINTLPTEDKVSLAQKLLGHDHGLTVVLGGNVITNSSVLQLNGSVDQISHQLKQLPPETLEQLLKAIAIRIAQDKI